ncbi:glycerate kinase-like isoform X2 [Ceratina calcarata]|uniref:Glycerate kinase n=1 Tax=Ceratina calcarata TaxID=156304 RepID=A0AAJ7WE78_9HYME|nr:glycerate kinase-like isoform X2 [Ceratina calcarata]
MRCNKILHKLTQRRPILSRSNLVNTVKFTSRKMSNDNKALEETRTILKKIYFAGIHAVSPKTLVLNKVRYEKGVLYIGDELQFELKENVYMVGFGKAVLGMAMVLEHVLGDCLKKGIVSIPAASVETLWNSEDKSYFPRIGDSVVDYCEGGENNQADERSYETTHNIIDLVESLKEDDSLIVLVSGGGSALLYMPRPAIDPDDKLHVCRMLQAAGADIKELNIVRSKLSMVKGGGLARMAYPASILSLILSDIVGDPIELIASGPTVYSNKRPKEVVAILKKYNLFDKVEGDVKKLLTSKERFSDKKLLAKRKKQFKHVTNFVLGNNSVAMEAAALEAYNHKLTPIKLRSDVVGDVHDVSLAYTHLTSLVCLAVDKILEKEEFFERVKDIPILSLTAPQVDEIYNLIDNISEEGLVLIGGGEPTVVLKGKGKGGRNQELALHFSLDWLAKIKSYPRFAKFEVIMLSAGTDGQDGPTDAAGAFGYPAIGPLIHDLYQKVKSIASTVIVQENEKKEAMMKKKEEKEQLNLKLEARREICKMQELSGSLVRKKEKKEDDEDEIYEPEEKPVDKEKMLQDEEDLDKTLPFILRTMEVERILPENTLNNNDSYNLYSRFKKGIDLFKPGLTGTNVMDLHLIHVRKRKCECKADFGKEVAENALDSHDLSIDPSTLEKYRDRHRWEPFKFEKHEVRPSVLAKEKAEQLNIKIIDDNLMDPCCRKDRKFPLKNLLKGKDLPLKKDSDSD